MAAHREWRRVHRSYDPFKAVTNGPENANPDTLTAKSSPHNTHRQTKQNFSFPDNGKAPPPQQTSSRKKENGKGKTRIQGKSQGKKQDQGKSRSQGKSHGKKQDQGKSQGKSQDQGKSQGKSQSQNRGASSSGPTQGPGAGASSSTPDYTPATKTAVSSAHSGALPSAHSGASDGPSISTGAIVGIAVGGAVGLLALVVLAWVLARWLKDDDREQMRAATPAHERPVSAHAHEPEMYNPYADVVPDPLPYECYGQRYPNPGGAGAAGPAVQPPPAPAPPPPAVAAPAPARTHKRHKHRHHRARPASPHFDEDTEWLYGEATRARRMRSSAHRPPARRPRHYARRSRQDVVSDLYTDSLAESALPSRGSSMSDKEPAYEEYTDDDEYDYDAAPRLHAAHRRPRRPRTRADYPDAEF